MFSNGVLLRKITKEEIDLFHSRHPTMWSDGAQLIYYINERTWVYEIKDKADILNVTPVKRADALYLKASRLVYVIQLAWRLMKNESGFCKIYVLSEKSKILSNGTIFPPFPYKPTRCTIDIKEIEEIDDLVTRISRLDLENNSPFRVAFERFSRSHEERRTDDIIIDLTIGFEALFTDYKTAKLDYMGKFVGLGCSMLLGKDNEERQFISAFLEKAFEVRNKIVHGDTFPNLIEVKLEKATKFPRILERFFLAISEISKRLIEETDLVLFNSLKTT